MFYDTIHGLQVSYFLAVYLLVEVTDKLISNADFISIHFSK